MEKNDGGPAFPTLAVVGDMAQSEGGLTLRDYFAGKYLEGFMASTDDDTTITANKLAFLAYKMADAMLEARKS